MSSGERFRTARGIFSRANEVFTGIVEHLGRVDSLVERSPGILLVIDAGVVADGAGIGDSVAINGCCLTVVEIDGQRLSFDAGAETLSRTNLGRLVTGSRVNLERSLKVGERLGGHFVTGHIDAAGHLDERIDDEQWSTCWFRFPEPISIQMASKGSIAIDGVSLTLVDVQRDRFSVALIPHTLQVTTLGALQPGDPVNLETDVLAKYVQQALARNEYLSSQSIPPLGES